MKHVEQLPKRKSVHGKRTRNPGYEPGNNWVECDVCGFTIRAKDAKISWDGKVVCPNDLDFRHPQDFVRGRKDKIVPDLLRPEGPINYLPDPVVVVPEPPAPSCIEKFDNTYWTNFSTTWTGTLWERANWNLSLNPIGTGPNAGWATDYRPVSAEITVKVDANTYPVPNLSTASVAINLTFSHAFTSEEVTSLAAGNEVTVTIDLSALAANIFTFAYQISSEYVGNSIQVTHICFNEE